MPQQQIPQWLQLAIAGGQTAYGAYSQNSNNSQARAAGNNSIAYGNDLIQQMFGLASGPGDASQQYLNNILGNSGGFNQGLNGNQQDVLSMLQGQVAGSPSTNDLFRNASGFIDPREISPGNREIYDQAIQDSTNRGQTDATRTATDRANDIFAAAPATGDAAQAGLDIINSGGRTPETNAIGQAMQALIDSGGVTSQNAGALGRGNNLVDSGGMTGPLASIQAQLSSLISGGGLSPEGKQLFGELMPLIRDPQGGGGALMPFDNAISFARDAAATAGQQNAEAQNRQAQQRGGAPGSVVSSGLQNQARAEFGDEQAQLEARAIRESAASQQNLQLQQFLGTQNTLGGIVQGGQQIRGQAIGGLGSVAAASAANLATGGRLIDSSLANQIATLGLGVQGANANQSNVNNRLGQGNSIFNGALQSYANLNDVAFRGLLGAEDQRAKNQQNAAGNLTNLGAQGLQARGQDLTGAANQANANNATSNLLANMANFGSTTQSNAAGTQADIYNNFLRNITSIYGSMSGTANTQANQVNTGSNPWIQGGVNAFGDFFEGYGKGSNTSNGGGGGLPDLTGNQGSIFIPEPFKTPPFNPNAGSGGPAFQAPIWNGTGTPRYGQGNGADNSDYGSFYDIPWLASNDPFTNGGGGG